MQFVSSMLEQIRNRGESFRHLSLLTASNIVASIAGLLIVILLANLLPHEDYGIYKYVLSVSGFLTVLSFTGGFKTTIIQSVGRGFDGIVDRLYKINPVLSLPMIVGGIGVAGYYYLHGNEALSFGILIATICNVFITNGVIASTYLNGRRDYRKLLGYQTAFSLTSLTSLAATLSVTRDVLIVIAVNTTAMAAVATFSFFVVRKLVRNADVNERVLHYGRHLNFLNVMTTVLQYIDSLFIFHFLGSYSLAHYAIATPFVDRILGFLKTSYFFVLPKFTERGPEWARTHLLKRSVIGLLFGILVFCAYALIAPIAFKLFFPKYLESVSLSILFALNIPLVAVSILPQAYVDSLIEIRNKYVIQSVNFVVRISSLVFFIHLFGIPGVIWSELLTRFGALVVILVIIWRRKKTPVNQRDVAGA